VPAVKLGTRLFFQQDCEHIFAPLDGERHIALAVSGGSDSMAMLRLARTWAKDSVRLTVLTVDHGLRSEAAAESKEVAGWCAGLSIDHHILRWQGEKPKTGLQAKARVARYDLMAGWCRANGVAWLLTAHTQDDQAETVAMRQVRTHTNESLAGIWCVREWQGIKIFRPLLGCRRAELRAYLQDVEQPWLDDPSNKDERFERVRVRNLLAGGEDRIADLAQIAENAGRASRATDDFALDWLGDNLIGFPEGYGSVQRADFAALEPDRQRRVLLKLVQIHGAASVVTPPELDQCSRWIMSGSLTRRTLGGAVLACRKETVLIGREPKRISSEPLSIPESGKIKWDGRFAIEGPFQSHVIPAGCLTGLARRKDIPAFVQAGLPAVLAPDSSVIVPHLGIGRGVSAKFMRCLR
jgi:tRNA(Ile)-lysidine synthase